MRNRMTETSPGHWNDNYNDVFIDKSGYHFIVSERLPGNNRHVWAGFIDFENAKALALRLANGR